MMRKNKKMVKGAFLGESVLNSAHKLVAPELVSPGLAYAFTFNPAHQPADLSAFPDWYRSYQRLFQEWPGCDIEVVPELSSKGRIHFHGYLTMISPFYFYFNLKDYTAVGTFELDIINDKGVWYDYVHKQRHVFLPTCQSLNLPYVIGSLYDGVMGWDADKNICNPVSYLF